MGNILKFSVDNMELMDKIEQKFFRKVKIKAFATGENAHTMPIAEDVLRRGAKTIYNKPILWKYNKYLDDANEHDKDEVPCGFVPESDDNPIEFEELNGKIYLSIQALIWTRYCGRLLDIFERDGRRKDVSIEIATIEKESNSIKPEIEDFVIAGITILGEMINPACKGCEAELLEFSENQKQYFDEMSFSESGIKIDNSKDAVFNGVWRNPRRKLFNSILKAYNSKDLLKEAYLISSSEDSEITKFQYPHHIIEDNKLVIHKEGLYDALKRVSQHGILSDDVKKHLSKHFKELGMSVDNFSEFSIDKKIFDLYFSENIIEGVGDLEMDNENKEVKMSEEVKEEKEEMACEEEMACKEKEMATEESKEEKEEMACEHQSEEKMEDDSEDKDGHDDENDNDKDDEEDKKEDEEEMSAVNFQEEMKKMSELISKLEEENAAYMSKIESMSDYEDLKKFKADTEERIVREKEMAEMEKVLSEISSRGFSVSEEDKKEFMSKIRDFSSIDAWSNYVKAQAFDRVENIDGFTKIGLPYTVTGNKKTGSIWDKL